MDVGRHMMVTGGREIGGTIGIFYHVYHEFPTVSTWNTETTPVIYRSSDYHRVFSK